MNSDQTIPTGHIFTWENHITIDECDKIVDFINTQIKHGKTSKEEYGHQSNVLSDTLRSKKGTEIDNIIFRIINKIVTEMNEIYDMGIKEDDGYQLRRIYGSTKYHIDGIVHKTAINEYNAIKLGNIRKMTVIIALNDDYEGGELCFPEQNAKVKLSKGQIIAFPPYWTHPHYSNELNNGTCRYTINTWLCE
tara:strand:+ start:2467 stop:3042 length:576 start_codon:yes stop_codon:yes gene_type:complete